MHTPDDQLFRYGRLVLSGKLDDKVRSDRADSSRHRQRVRAHARARGANFFVFLFFTIAEFYFASSAETVPLLLRYYTNAQRSTWSLRRPSLSQADLSRVKNF